MRVVPFDGRALPRRRARRRQGRVAGADGGARAAGAAGLRRARLVPGRRAARRRRGAARAARATGAPRRRDWPRRRRRSSRAVEPAAELRASIEASYAALGDGDAPVAVRSSACAEDSETASFAGQQETYLHVRGADRRCCGGSATAGRSFFTERALFYRSRKGALDDLGMAVVVQRMVDADVAGVLFTIDPTRGRRDRMLVEAVFGLGEAVVSGEVTPDHYVLARDGRLKKLAADDPALRGRARPGRRRPARSRCRRSAARAQTLDEDAARAARRASAATSRSGSAARRTSSGRSRRGELFVLQARPVTA